MKRTTFRLLAVSSLLMAAIAMAGTRPRYGGTVRIETSGTGWEEDGVARRLVGETLTSFDEKGQLQPALAIRWEAQNGGRRWQFWLRPGVKFHDGSVLSAGSVAQALSASSCKSCPWRSARAAGETVVFESDASMPLLPAQLATSKFVVTKVGDNGATIGTGPFRVVQATPGATTLKSFDDYWQSAAYLDTIEITGGRKARDQWLDLSVGRADVIEIPADQMRRAQQERLHVTASRSVELVALVIVGDDPALNDVRIRQAIAESIDRNSLLNVIFQRQGEATATLLPNWMTGHGPLFPSARDLDQARELRGQWIAPISPMTIGYDAGDSTAQLIAERIALNVREIGLNVQAQPLQQKTGADIRLVRARLSSQEPSVALEKLAGELALAGGTPDDTTPEAVLKRERAILADFKAIPLLYLPDGYATSERVRNWHVGSDGFPNFTDAWAEVRR